MLVLHRAIPLLIVVAAGLQLNAGTSEPMQVPAVVSVDEKLLEGLRWRAVGPAVFGGRVSDVAGVAGNPNVLYVAFASAGLFKSADGGISFQSIFDAGNTLSIGAIAVAPANPDVIYVGTGEGKPRNSTSFGDGIYRSRDGGKTWTHLGLQSTERFARLAVHPRDANIVFAAAMGHEWGANDERGVYRSTDAGQTWQRMLFVNGTTGAADLAIDPGNPRIVYAAMYDYLRQPWHFRSGGPGSGLYRSSDGGETWTRLSDPALNNGLPKGTLGRIGLAISPGRPEVVYAIIENDGDGVLWRSDDRGDRWQLTSRERAINARPFYFSVIRVDPANENRIYSLNRSLHVSDDGGKTFRSIDYWRIFGDFHAMWIDPSNASRVLAGSDGGFYISNDRGERWDFLNKISAAQVYRFALDNADPYHIVGGFQDHEIWQGPNERWNVVGVTNRDWRRLRDHGDGASVVVDPRDPNIVYYNTEHGDITRVDLRTAEERFVQPYPVTATGIAVSQEKYRFNWIAPVAMSPTNPDVIYLGGNVLFRTKDGGANWTIISPDLTTNNPDKQKMSGGVTPDNSRAESHCTIHAIAESPRDPNVIWVGTDDGMVQITTNAGQQWTNVAPAMTGAPPFAYISSIQASHVEAGKAYVAVDQHRLDDFAPYAFVTTDYGRTWRSIAKGLRGYVHIVIEDPKAANLLYAGTELGVFVSFDAGTSWTDLRLGLPRLSVMDIKVHPRDDDLVIGTHARGFFVLDDVTPLRALAGELQRPVTLFPPRTATRYTPASDASSLGGGVYVAPNKPYGASLTYFLGRAAVESGVEIQILDNAREPVRTLRGGTRQGLNRVVWDLRRTACGSWTPASGRLSGGRVVPGRYTARLTASGETVEQPFDVRLDPRVKASDEDLLEHSRSVSRLVAMECSARRSIEQLADVEQQLAALETRASPATWKEASALRGALRAVSDRFESNPRGDAPLNLSRKITRLREEVEAYTGLPTAAQQEWTGIFEQQLQDTTRALDRVFTQDLVKLNERLRGERLPAVVAYRSNTR